MDRHGTSVETLADVVIHARNMEDELPSILRRQFHQKVDLLQNEHIKSFLHDRLMIQLLCEHYRSLNKGKMAGAVSLNVDILDCVDDAITDLVHVYPNPVQEFLYIDGVSDSKISISSVNGKVSLYMIRNGKVDISSLVKGIYFLSLELNGNDYSLTFVKM